MVVVGSEGFRGDPVESRGEEEREQSTRLRSWREVGGGGGGERKGLKSKKGAIIDSENVKQFTKT